MIIAIYSNIQHKELGRKMGHFMMLIGQVGMQKNEKIKWIRGRCHQQKKRLFEVLI